MLRLVGGGVVRRSRMENGKETFRKPAQRVKLFLKSLIRKGLAVITSSIGRWTYAEYSIDIVG